MIFLHISVSRLIPLIGHVITVFTITEAKVELINDIYQKQPITCEQKIKNVLSTCLTEFYATLFSFEYA